MFFLPFLRVLSSNYSYIFILKVRGEIDEKTNSQEFKVDAVKRVTCHADKSYLLVGGLGGFGIELAQWLVDRGAKKLVLTSRSGVKSGFQAKRIKQWQKAGVNVVVSTWNVADPKEAGLLIAECQEDCAGLGGVFNLAVVILDGLLDSQNPERYLYNSNLLKYFQLIL